MNYRNILIEKIEKLIRGEFSVPQFTDSYYGYFLEEVSQDVLTDIETAFFGLIQETLDWTVENPSEEDKKYGYLNYSGYTDWLKENYRRFSENENLWYSDYLSSFKRNK